jgi:4a-hydroxytetrahydrobiopterin dehydratase
MLAGMADALSAEQLAGELASLPAWTLTDGSLHRELEFADFGEAFAFMTRVALAAEKADHHPDWSNSWNRVVIDLVTHSAGGVTENDLALARRIDQLAG